jgi:hypothetical protein
MVTKEFFSRFGLNPVTAHPFAANSADRLRPAERARVNKYRVAAFGFDD